MPQPTESFAPLPSPGNDLITIALSGGVDSSVAAWLLRERGHRIRGLFMKNWEEDDSADHCAAAVDLADAEAVCQRLDIELDTVNLSSEYWDNVFERFLEEHRLGRTPNPDVLCNREIKFDAFLDFALAGEAKWLATGHYARVERCGGDNRLLKARDSNKDQTYFLHALHAHQLERVLFPLGELTKPQVRGLALAAALPTSEKKDSTGICFIGERPFKSFLSRYVPPAPGDIVDTHGVTVGRHDGLAYFTPGQRQGLGIGGRRGSSGAPWYVVEKNLADNILVVAQGKNHPRLWADTLSLSACHWINTPRFGFPLRCAAKVRYRQPEARCSVSSGDGCTLEVQFDEMQWAPAPGQSVVFYDDTACLGGGTIEAAWTARRVTSGKRSAG